MSPQAQRRERARRVYLQRHGVQLHGHFDMSFWSDWVRQPQRVWLRRALFQIHLWCGLAIGLYIVVLSVTGSALVYRRELNVWLAAPRPVFDPNGKRLTKDELRAA